MKEKHKLQPLIRAFGRADKSKIDSARQKSRQQAYRLILDQLNRDIRPLLSEIVKQHRQKSSGSTIDRPHTDSGGLISASRSEFGSESIGLRVQSAGFLEKGSPVVGQRDAAGGAHHQAGAEVLLKKPDEASKRRGQHFYPPRGSAEMQFFGRRHEASQLIKVHRFSLGPQLYHFFV
jgi:hypothetical protein